jgi:hypothetical protein
MSAASFQRLNYNPDMPLPPGINKQENEFRLLKSRFPERKLRRELMYDLRRAI